MSEFKSQEQLRREYPLCASTVDDMLVSSARIWESTSIPDTCGIDFRRYDTEEHYVERTGKTYFEAGTTIMTDSSILLDKDGRFVWSGELAVPHPIYVGKEKEIKNLGCEAVETHEHIRDLWGNIAHIHFYRCPIENRVKLARFIKTVSDVGGL